MLPADLEIKDNRSWGIEKEIKHIKYSEVLFIFKDGKDGLKEFLNLLAKYHHVSSGMFDTDTFYVDVYFNKHDFIVAAMLIYYFAKHSKFNLYIYPRLDESMVIDVFKKILNIEFSNYSMRNCYVTMKIRIRSQHYAMNGRHGKMIRELNLYGNS